MTGLRYSPLHVTEFCGEMQGKFKVGLARLINLSASSSLGIAPTSFYFGESKYWRYFFGKEGDYEEVVDVLPAYIYLIYN